MASRRTMQALVAAAKAQRPSMYCPARRCLWRTGGGFCPRHAPSVTPGIAAYRAERRESETEV